MTPSTTEAANPLRRFVVTASLARTPSEGLALAIVLLCVDRDVSASTAGVLVAATSLPQLLSGPILGHRLDRAIDVWRAVRVAAIATAVAAVALMVGVGKAPMGMVIAAAVLVAVAEPTFTGGISAAVDRTMPHDAAGATAVHAWDSFSYNVAGLLAPALVTVVAATAGPAPATGALAGCVLVGGIVSIGLRTRSAEAPSAYDNPAGRSKGVAAAARAMLTEPTLRAVTIATTLAFAAFGGLAFAAVAAARDAGRSANDAGELFTLLAVGGLIGSLVMTRRSQPVRPERTVAISMVVIGLALLGMAATDRWAVVLVGAAVVGLLDGPLLVGVFAARIHHAPVSVRTTVFTLGASAKLGGSAVGAIVASHLLGDRATSAGLAVIGVVHLTAGALCRLAGVAR